MSLRINGGNVATYTKTSCQEAVKAHLAHVEFVKGQYKGLKKRDGRAPPYETRLSFLTRSRTAQWLLLASNYSAVASTDSRAICSPAFA
jgi:hypothetical protein